MSLRAALTLLVLTAPSMSRAVPGRLSCSVLAGGGYASDVFVGADLGSGAMWQTIPGARLDLALDPQWKLSTYADFSYGHYVTSGFTSLAQSATIEGRYLPNPQWNLTLLLNAEHARYSLGVPIDPSTGTGPSVLSSLATRVSPILRVLGYGLEWRVAGTAAARTSTAIGGDVSEYDLAVLAGILYPFSANGSFALTYKLNRTESPRSDSTLTSHALFALLDWKTGPFDLQAQLQLQSAFWATATPEGFGRLTLSATYPISHSVDIETTYSFAASHSDDSLPPSASRHLLFLALRWRLAEVSW